MNPWAISPGDDNFGPTKEEALQAARMAFGDRAPESGDGLNPAMSPLDFPAELAALARMGVSGLSRAGVAAFKGYEGKGLASEAINMASPPIPGEFQRLYVGDPSPVKGNIKSIYVSSPEMGPVKGNIKSMYVGSPEMGPMFKNPNTHYNRPSTVAAFPEGRPAIVSNVGRNHWAEVKNFLGEDIAKMSPRDLGYKLDDIGGGIPSLGGAQVNGAYARSKYGTSDLYELEKILSKELKIPRNELVRAPEGAFGSYNYATGDIGMASEGKHMRPGVIDPIANDINTLLHEKAGHAYEHFYHPDFMGRPELAGVGSKQVKDEILRQALQGIEPSVWRSMERMQLSMDKAAADNIAKGFKGKAYKGYTDDMYNAVQQHLHPKTISGRDALSGNRLINAREKVADRVFDWSRLGDPMHQMEMRSLGHMKNFNSFEGQYAQKNERHRKNFIWRGSSSSHHQEIRPIPVLRAIQIFDQTAKIER